MTASTEAQIAQKEKKEPESAQESLEEPAADIAAEQPPADDPAAGEAEKGEEEPPAGAQELKSERVQ